MKREIKFIGLFGDRGHRGPYSPYKLCNHNLYIGMIIFPHIDNINLWRAKSLRKGDAHLWQWHWNQGTDFSDIFIKIHFFYWENEFENIVGKMVVILSRT